uniref:Uncharacterized protein n=1 Tax=Candidatus Kentrum eta TaxID=2126337 RepID=A0A450VGD6_9GAMM|nr:MAG: hypothetical protein BECKH772B_GA0070898_103824 [Candidatus Kentron sp. H]VFK04253.1 MAG: hypothetical protein BECKH772A_GA0070896_103954 [Candidatus Kentron sp. H]VFK06943.1 MAG: hypothetical protein BECKH772C_GA0070978_103854 [Candidatus Kentron sp. H]
MMSGLLTFGLLLMFVLFWKLIVIAFFCAFISRAIRSQENRFEENVICVN